MGTSASFARKISACFIAALLSLALVPASALAEDGTGVDEEAGAASPDVILSEGTEGPEVEESDTKPLTLASGLVGAPSNFINSDVALDGEPVIGSFTVDGLTFAVIDESTIELVGVSPDWQQVTNSQEGEGASVAPMLASGSDGDESETATPSVILSEGSEAAGVEESNSNQASEAGLANLALPETVAYEGVDYTLASIAPYAFYLSGVTDVTLPASVSDVDERAFRSSDVANVTVAEGNQDYSSFDGALYSADKTRLLLIPEGRVGAVLLPREAEVADPGKFSHCSLVDAISVEDGAAFASENGLLYSSDLTTLLRVPAGATEATIREGCTTIAAGALEACAKLTTINAPATVTSISPDVFHATPTVSLPAASLAEEAPQLTAMVALSSTDDDLPKVNPASIQALLPKGTDWNPWSRFSFVLTEVQDESASLSSATPYAAYTMTIYANGHTLRSYWLNDAGIMSTSYTTSYFRYTCHHYVPYPLNISVYPASSGDSRYSVMEAEEGWKLLGFRVNSQSGAWMTRATTGTITSLYAVWAPCTYTVDFDVNGYSGTTPESIAAIYDQELTLPGLDTRPGYRFLGWNTENDGAGIWYQPGTVSNLTATDKETVTLYAQWEPISLDFETSAEPGDEDYPGEEKPSISAPDAMNGEGKVEIEDPKRPGYVFQGWTIPNAEGTEAIEQDLVYQGDDGKWYVDASKLPDYYEQLKNEEGKIELTARWTSVISVDVPSSVTFYADVVTQGNESREGLASSAFGQSKVASQSEVDLRIVGLESNQVKGNGSTSLGASDILKKKDGSTVSGTDDKLFSLYPATGELTEDDLKDPDATSASKPEGAVDFSLDDILLEKSFAADEFTIPAGDTLSLGYRLNLQETSTELDYDKLSTLSEGASASIANISYCFATEGLVPTGSTSDPLYVTVDETFLNANDLAGVVPVGTYGLADIKAAATDFSARVSRGSNPDNWDDIEMQLADSPYLGLYRALLESQITSSGHSGAGPYFQLEVGGVYLDLQLIGICQDTKADGSGKAGLTFQMRDLYAWSNTKSKVAGQGEFLTWIYNTNSNRGGWNASAMRERLRAAFAVDLNPVLQAAIAPVSKHQSLGTGDIDQMTQVQLQPSTSELVWLPSIREVFGAINRYTDTEDIATLEGYAPFQYEAYRGNNGLSRNAKAVKTWNGGYRTYWLRSAYILNKTDFCTVQADGSLWSTDKGASESHGIAPAFCL